ncbi:MAG: MBL fold metallo-hydrolase, partial [Candidatus Nanopelagicales bacterium]
MTYSGDVHVGGPAAVHELPHLIVSKMAVGPMDNNAYLLRCRDTGEQVLIDAAAEPRALLDLIGSGGIEAVITTHRHADHWQALGEVVAATGATTIAGRYDAEGIPVMTDVLLDDGDEIAFGSVTLRAIHLIGHTPGSIALVYDDPDGQAQRIPMNK